MKKTQEFSNILVESTQNGPTQQFMFGNSLIICGDARGMFRGCLGTPFSCGFGMTWVCSSCMLGVLLEENTASELQKKYPSRFYYTG